MDTSWSYEQNVFLNVTEGNLELMYELSDTHYNSMRSQDSQPYFKDMADNYEPFWQTLRDAFGAIKAGGGTHKSETLSVDQQLALGAKNLARWEPFITQLYPKGSPGYVRLFPQNHYPFTQGKKDMRIKAYETLASMLAGIPELTTVQAEALAYWQQMNDQRNTQQESLAQSDADSAAAEAARIGCGDMMYADLGSLMNKFYKDRHQITLYFDLEKIRQHQQVVFQRQVKPLETLFVVKHTFPAAATFTCMNKGVKPLYLYMGASKTTPFSEANSILIAPGATVVIDAGKLGAPDNAFLFVYNPDTFIKGECEIDFMQ